MIAGLDSSDAKPSAAQLQQAHAAGVRAWAGYFDAQNINHHWAQADFDRIKAAGMGTWAYCSGFASATAMKALSAAWGVPICLDVEGGIRGDGPWVQSWLDASGAGLYGNAPVFAGRRASFYVLAAYPATGNPGTSWPHTLARPNRPCGWQWQGTHTEFGCSVDRGNFDDGFATFGITHGSSGSSRMFAFRPDGSDRHDVVLVTGNGSNLRHWWSGNIASDATNPPPHEDWGAPAGKTLLAGTEWVAWDSPGSWMTWGAQASDGSQWFGWGTLANGNVSGWKPWASVTSDVPAGGGPPGATGPAGPTGPAASGSFPVSGTVTI